MSNYIFRGSMSLSVAEVRRIESEREAEQIYSSFCHHAAPHREIDDHVRFALMMRTPRCLTRREESIVEEVLNEFAYRFMRVLEDRLQQEAQECAEQSKRSSQGHEDEPTA